MKEQVRQGTGPNQGKAILGELELKCYNDSPVDQQESHVSQKERKFQ